MPAKNPNFRADISLIVQPSDVKNIQHTRKDSPTWKGASEWNYRGREREKHLRLSNTRYSNKIRNKKELHVDYLYVPYTEMKPLPTSPRFKFTYDKKYKIKITGLWWFLINSDQCGFRRPSKNPKTKRFSKHEKKGHCLITSPAPLNRFLEKKRNINNTF